MILMTSQVNRILNRKDYFDPMEKIIDETLYGRPLTVDNLLKKRKYKNKAERILQKL